MSRLVYEKYFYRPTPQGLTLVNGDFLVLISAMLQIVKECVWSKVLSLRHIWFLCFFYMLQ